MDDKRIRLCYSKEDAERFVKKLIENKCQIDSIHYCLSYNEEGAIIEGLGIYRISYRSANAH